MESTAAGGPEARNRLIVSSVFSHPSGAIAGAAAVDVGGRDR